MMKHSFSLFACLAVAGCVQYSEIESKPQQVNFSDATASQNVHRTTISEIRTIITDPNGNGKKQIEIEGASCEISGHGYALRVISPAKVALPTYLGATDAVDITCATDQKTETHNIPAINATEEGLRSGSSQGSLLGILVEQAVKTSIAVGRDPSKDKFRYPTVIKFDMTPNGT